MGARKELPTPAAAATVAVARRGRGWQIGYRAADGSYARRLFATKAQADVAAARIRTEAWEARASGRSAVPRWTLAELSRRQLDRGRSTGKRSIAHDESRWTVILDVLGRETPVASIRPADIDRLRTALLSRPQRPRGRRRPMVDAPALPPMSLTTVNRHVALLSSALTIALENGVISESPVTRGHRTAETHRDRVASPEEIERLLRSAPRRLRLAILLATETLWRRGTLTRLEWSHIDLTRREMTAAWTKNGQPVRVPLSKAAARALEVTPPPLRRGRVIGLHADTITHSFSRLATRLGLRDLRFHDLRHTAATRLISLGVPWQVVQYLGGWRSVAAMSRYVNLRVTEARAALDAID